MGIFNKIKNVLFEEEEIEVPVEEPIKPKKTEIEKKTLERKRNVFEEEEKDEAPIISDRELFKSEKTFDFPVFDDQEFENMKKLPEEELFEEKPKKSVGINLFDYEKSKIKKEINKTRAEEIKGRAYETKKPNEIDAQKFRPSPVISPVYGVLDKNYKKEDIVSIKEDKKRIDVDDVRKKAFGTLEDDIEKNILEPKKEVFEEKEIKTYDDEKWVDELLEEAATKVVDMKENNEYKRAKSQTMELDILDRQIDKTEEEQLDENDTLENDLFDLIDSMYEEKEEE